MSFSVRPFLLVASFCCIFPLSSVADEVKGRVEPSQVASDLAVPPQDVQPGPAVDKPESTSESADEAPPKLPRNPETSQVEAPLEGADSSEEIASKSFRNWESSANPVELPDLQRQSVTLKAIKDDLKEAIDLADQLALRLDALEFRAATQNQASSPFVVSAPAVVADRIHVFIMADTRTISGGRVNAIKNGAAANASMMKALLESQCKDSGSGISHLAGPVRVLKDAEFSFEKLKQELTATIIGSNDVLFVYFACHGGTFNDSARSHFFQTPNPNRNNTEVLARNEVWNLMKGRSARQTILITDTCSNATSVTPYSISPLAVAAPPTNALSRLLLYQIGDVDISGSSRPPADNGDGSRRGQFGIYNDAGGFFTSALLSASLGTPEPVSWKRLFDNAQRELSAELAGGVRVNLPGGGFITVTRQTYELVPD